MDIRDALQQPEATSTVKVLPDAGNVIYILVCRYNVRLQQEIRRVTFLTNFRNILILKVRLPHRTNIGSKTNNDEMFLILAN